MANAGTLAGHVTVEDMAVLGGLCGVHQFVRIGKMSIVGGCSKAVKDIPPFMMADGNPALVHGLNSIGLKRRNVPLASREVIKKAYKILYRSDLLPKDAAAQIAEEFPDDPEARYLVDFILSSERGITGAPD